ncbi:MAG: response regulator [Blastochloris sp.]|nr:response regulator [Blastochloris sp.]
MALRILLVEDDPWLVHEVRHALGVAFPSAGCDLAARPTIAGAWAWLHTNPAPTVIVIDQFLAGGDRGETLAAQLQADPQRCTIPRIAYSQLPMHNAEAFTYALLKQPVHEALCQQIQRFLRLHTAR